jgi:uncharacterized membrane protein
VRATERAASIGQFTAFVLGFIGLFHNPILVFIAVFVYLAAASEAHSVALRAASRGVPVSQAMMSHFVTLQPDTHIDEAINVLLQTSQGTFPVVDGNGSFVGALDRANILQSVKQTAPDACVDAVATVMGSWSFIIVQSAILFVWITANLVGAIRGWDPYPFILLNLAPSFQAAYAAPVIMMSQNRQQDIDRRAAENDYRINVKAELEIELLHEKIDQLREREGFKLTEAVRTLTELLEQSASGARESDAEGGQPS